MKLRARLALATLAAVVPLLGGIALLAAATRRQAIEETLARYARTIVASSRAACEAAPERWGGPYADDGDAAALQLELYAYDADYRSKNTDAPVLDPVMIAEARAGDPQVVRSAAMFEVLVQSTGEGPCAHVLVRRPATRPGVGAPRFGAWLVTAPLLVTALVLGVMLILLGPIVRRIQRLRDEVRAAAAAGYRQPPSVGGDDEIAELAAAFAESGRLIVGHLDAQARRERTLREFVANTTHDVMVPLTVLQGHLTALHGGATDPEIMRAAMQEADYIASLLRNLEVAARLDAGEPQLARDPVDLVPLVARVAARHTPLARRRAIELVHATPPDPVVVRGDLTLIEQALGNLVQNAAMHHRGGGHVAIVLEDEGASAFRVTVRDDGPGMTPDEIARVLARGERGDAARTRHPHGKGLGLSIAARVAAAHGWRLDLHTGPEGGLVVELSGPAETL